jgi:hypothetical protein
MSLSPIKFEILETMLLIDKPLKATAIAKEAKKEFPPVMMHLIGLTRMGYICSPEKGVYVITEKGKKALGIPETNKETAKAILCYAPHDKAFSFYADVGKPLNLHAHTLQDFANKIHRADIGSIQFHLNRGDFEAWFNCIGDAELAKKASVLKEKKMVGEELRKKLSEIVEKRCQALSMISGQAAVPS